MSVDRMPWFKWWDGTAADMKFRMVAEDCKLPVACIVGAWAYLLEHASRSVDRGSIADVDYELMSYTLQIPDCETVCNAMKRRKLLHENGEITKWEDRQGKREKSEPSGASSERVRRFREKQKQSENKGIAQIGTGNEEGNDETDETVGNGTKRPKKKNREEEDTKPKPTSPSGDDGKAVKPFDRFWEAWPNKVAKVEAQKAWAAIKPDADLVDKILAAIEAQKDGDYWRRDDGQYIGHPATWLRGGRWLDVVRPYVEPKEKPNRGAWWVSKESMEAFGLTLDPPLKPNIGEYMRDFAARINAALDRIDSGLGPAPAAQPTTYVPPMPADGEHVLTKQQRQARLAEMREQTGMRKQSEAATTE